MNGTTLDCTALTAVARAGVRVVAAPEGQAVWEDARMDAETLLTTTRSVRRKLDPGPPGPDEVITDCLRIALQVPAAGPVGSGRPELTG
jgi:hypothetical protein